MMKKNLVMMAVFAGMLAFTACNNDEPVTNGVPDTPDTPLQAGEGRLSIELSNTGVNTRAARPMGSSAAANTVTDVKLVAYKKNGTSWELTADVKIKDDTDLAFSWTVDDQGEGASITARAEEQTVTLTGLEADATYKFVAYGYNAADPYGSTDTDNDFIFETQTTKTGYEIEEIFAGATEEISTNDQSKFTKTVKVTLTRQVAGILAYFTNVPTYINGTQVKKIEVCANKKTSGFKFPASLLTTDKELNGTGTGVTDNDVLMTFNLDQIAANYDEVAADNTIQAYTFNSTNYATETKKPFATGYTPATGLKLAENSIFGARFIMPYDQHYDAQTLTVKMYGTDGTTVLKTLNVVTDKAVNGSKTNYDIRCNNFYSIGKKLYTNNTGGDPDPTDPDKPGTPDPDTPVDLNKNTNITVIINDAWEILHNMDVE